MNYHDFYITPEEYETAAANGVKKETLEYRVRGAGWNKHDAIHTETRKLESVPQEVLDRAEANGICYSTLLRRINTGWDMERACTETPTTTSENARIQSEKLRKYPKELIELAVSNGINVKTFYRRVKDGWDMYVAATRKTLNKDERMAIARQTSPWNKDHKRYVGNRKGQVK